MAWSGTLLFFTVAYLSALQIQAGCFTLDCTKENIGLIGQQSMLECVVNVVGEEGKLPEIEMIVWKKVDVDNPLLKYKNKVEPSPRHSFAHQSWNGNNGNVSMLIANTEIADEDDYKCFVMTSCGGETGVTRLKSKAKYQKPTIDLSDEKMNSNDEKTLICRTDGGYPSGELRWFSENDEWTKSAKMEVKRMYNGLFSLTSRLPLLPGSTLPQYTCVVYNASGSKEDSATFQIPSVYHAIGQDPGVATPHAKVVAPVVIIGSLIVGLLLVLVVRKRCSPCKPHMDYTREEKMEEGELQNMRPDADIKF